MFTSGLALLAFVRGAARARAASPVLARGSCWMLLSHYWSRVRVAGMARGCLPTAHPQYLPAIVSPALALVPLSSLPGRARSTQWIGGWCRRVAEIVGYYV